MCNLAVCSRSLAAPDHPHHSQRTPSASAFTLLHFPDAAVQSRGQIRSTDRPHDRTFTFAFYSFSWSRFTCRGRRASPLHFIDRWREHEAVTGRNLWKVSPHRRNTKSPGRSLMWDKETSRFDFNSCYIKVFDASGRQFGSNVLI